MHVAQGRQSVFEPQLGTMETSGLHYLSAGQGDPIVFLHGVGGFKELWWSVQRALAPSYYTLALDWPGHGSPPLSSATAVLSELARLAIRSCEALDLHRITLVGHSLGGNVAARVALERPDLVKRLVLVDAAVHVEHLPFSGRLYVHQRWADRASHIHGRVTRALGALGAGVPHEHGGGVLRPWARRCFYMSRVEGHVLQSFVRAVYQDPLGDAVRAIQQPVLVVSGSRDLLVRPGQARTLARTIPHAHLAIIRGAYHNPMDERPAEFLRILRSFIDEHPIEP